MTDPANETARTNSKPPLRDPRGDRQQHKPTHEKEADASRPPPLAESEQVRLIDAVESLPGGSGKAGRIFDLLIRGQITGDVLRKYRKDTGWT